MDILTVWVAQTSDAHIDPDEYNPVYLVFMSEWGWGDCMWFLVFLISHVLFFLKQMKICQ